ncbi:MAG: threonine synthase [Rhodospirillaceae bacterium]|nr:threonine synthase [Rhodospirillaceae bacterium]
MRYISTRGTAEPLNFEDAMLTGLARDGGLYVPETWPHFSDHEIRAMRSMSYPELATVIMRPFIGDTFTEHEFREMVEETYAGFDHPAVAPLRQLDGGLWLMELFHGPTIAFKDYAMQLLGRMFDKVLTRRGERVTIVGATSGDTGSAAIEACRDRAAIDCFILFPNDRVSEVQRRQMTTVQADNVHSIALEGTFDDCQDMLKALFNDMEFRDRHNLSAVNSINWARLMPQIVYYFWAATALGAPDRPVAFAVPSGNFGNVFSAYAAKNMGLPIERLMVGSNRNDILTRFFTGGTMQVTGVEPSLSPSMDIQVSSNFERLLFDLYDRDGPAVADVLTKFRETGSFTVSQGMLERAQELFEGHATDDTETTRVIAETWKRTAEIIDPHTAVGVDHAMAARAAGRIAAPVPIISLACAHPAKFPDAVEAAIGSRPPLPKHMADLLERPERMTVLANDKAAVSGFIAEHVAGGKGAA